MIYIIGLIFALAFTAVGFIYSFQLLTFFPSLVLALISLIYFYLDVKDNTWVIIFSKINGKDVINRIMKCKKYWNNKRNVKAFYLKITGFDPTPCPDDKFPITIMKGKIVNAYCFYSENGLLAPILVSLDVDKVKFVSNELIANDYQKKQIVNEMVKPPADNLQAIINIGLIIVMILLAITIIYNTSKLGMLGDNFAFLTERIDSVMEQMSQAMTQLQEAITGAGSSIGDLVPPAK